MKILINDDSPASYLLDPPEFLDQAAAEKWFLEILERTAGHRQPEIINRTEGTFQIQEYWAQKAEPIQMTITVYTPTGEKCEICQKELDPSAVTLPAEAGGFKVCKYPCHQGFAAGYPWAS